MAASKQAAANGRKCQIWTTLISIDIEPASAPNGGYLRTGRRPAPVTERDPIFGPASCRIADSARVGGFRARLSVLCKISLFCAGPAGMGYLAGGARLARPG